MSIKYWLLLLSAVAVLGLSLFLPRITEAYTSPGSPTGLVNDFAGILPPEDEVALESNLRQFMASTTHEIAVVTVGTTGEDSIEEYAVNLFKEWGIGKKEADNGVLMLVAVQDRTVRIEVGYGLEAVLTDARAQKIISEDLRPAFQKGDFYGGLSAGVHSVEEVISAEPPAPPKPIGKYDYIFGLGIFAFVLGVLGFGIYRLLRSLKHLYEGLKKNRTLERVKEKFSSQKDDDDDRPSRSSGVSSSSGNSSPPFQGFGGGSSGGGGASGKW